MRKFMFPLAALCFTLFVLGCGDNDTTTPSENETSLSGACQIVQDFGDCGACYSGVVTCTYGDLSVTEGSCQGCQPLLEVYTQLCNNGSTDSAEDIEAGVECTDPVPE